VKKFNKRYEQLMEDVGGALAAGAGVSTGSAGIGSTSAANNVPIGQSSDKIYAQGDTRNLFGTAVDKSKKKSKFKALKKNPGFKTPFKIIRRNPPNL
jgi:hypothetical protein